MLESSVYYKNKKKNRNKNNLFKLIMNFSIMPLKFVFDANVPIILDKITFCMRHCVLLKNYKMLST